MLLQVHSCVRSVEIRKFGCFGEQRTVVCSKVEQIFVDDLKGIPVRSRSLCRRVAPRTLTCPRRPRDGLFDKYIRRSGVCFDDRYLTGI